MLNVTPELELHEYQSDFFQYLEDSILMLMEAEKAKKVSLKNALVRGSIIFSLLLPEIAANILIEMLDLEQSIFTDIDKLSVVGKMDYFVRVKYREKIERGEQYAQDWNEIKKIRDSMVHPRRTKVKWIHENGDTYRLDAEYSNNLRINKNTMLCTIEDALTIMNVVHSFLSNIFNDKCGYSPKETTNILLSNERNPKATSDITPTMRKTIKGKVDEWEIKISYLEILWF